MGVSGAEAVVAAASPWIGQGRYEVSTTSYFIDEHSGESACLVKPYVDRT